MASMAFNFVHPDRDGMPVDLNRTMSKPNNHYDDSVEQGVTADPEVDRHARVGELARQLTRMSTRPAENLFDYQEGSDLDPFSAHFDARKYAKGIAKFADTGVAGKAAGISFSDMGVHGFGSDADYQRTVGNLPASYLSQVRDMVGNRQRKVQILNSVDGLLEAGEMLVVLGPPGSGCSTLLKTIAGEMNGIYLDEGSNLNYRGITAKQMRKQFRGEAIYTAEVDVHFPILTVGQTLAAAKHPPPGLTRQQYAEHSRDVTMSVFGISHTMNSKVGNDFIRGVSGGERKRVTICEATLSGAPLQCWDNSTRGLDSANAIEFCKNLRVSADYFSTTSAVAIYQAPQSAYDLFDKVSVLYEGEQIFFGKCTEAKAYFIEMGFHCPDQQTTPDFLTSLTSASERTAREGFESRVPHTPAEFVSIWKKSPQYHALRKDILSFEERYPVNGERFDEFLASRRIQQSSRVRAKSPYTLSYGQQVRLCLKRGFWRLKADPSLTYTQLFGNFIMSLVISSVFYNLRPFFFFLLISFIVTLTMSMIFRSIASLSREFVQAMTPAAVIMIGIIVYTGFAIPVTYMRGWARWINYIDPVGYAFESLMVNEFHGREFSCAALVPSGAGYADTASAGNICSVVGSVAGQNFVNGDTYLALSYEYYHSHKWRNLWILFIFLIGFLVIYLGATELISAVKSKGEILVYPRGRLPQSLVKHSASDVESQMTARPGSTDEKGADATIIQRQTSIFSWRDVVYDIKIKKETRRILDHVDGWGVSGAGKTTLLDVLATRVTMGVVTGEMLVDGRQRDVSFQRKTGYVQQQDLHLATSTVREALRFSAVLRQPKHISKAEKYAYVEEVLKLLEMDPYADAVVGVPGLNVEQRKRLTIGVELVAKPALLLFLDEPTSGLDSQTSWNILQLLRKLTEHGQAILCTIHQPSAILFENFDRLLFLAKGGKTVYFGEVGTGSHILIDYFVRNGASDCPPGENPAEWMLSAIGAAPGTATEVDWHQAWLNSPERGRVHEELDRIKRDRPTEVANEKDSKGTGDAKLEKAAYSEFAAPFGTQLAAVLQRGNQQYWRTPSYIWSKIALSVATGLFIGFSFYKSDTSQQGLQSQLFSAFMMFTMFSQLCQQIMPNFVVQRSLYEVRERPSKTYSWKVFILSNLLVEIPYAILVGTIFFFCWYYPIGYYVNAVSTNTVHIRGFEMYLLMLEFFLFSSVSAIAAVAGMDSAETAGNIVNLLFSLCLVFCGVLVPYTSLPGFWKFMYRVSPFTYFVEGILGVAVGNAAVVCGADEYLHFNPPSGTCGDYMQSYIASSGGYLQNPEATSDCSFCTIADTNTFLESVSIRYGHRWRDFGLLWVYIVVNIFLAFAFYWLVRVPKNSGKEQATETKQSQENIAPPQNEKTK
ncbi:ATP-binding cassette, subfamily G (WHITE), member 2, PDR, partial [Tremellales sp. Uapishka_1]